VLAAFFSVVPVVPVVPVAPVAPVDAVLAVVLAAGGVTGDPLACDAFAWVPLGVVVDEVAAVVLEVVLIYTSGRVIFV
jgi:hypothetical protein